MPFLRTKPVEIKLVGPNLVAAFHRAQPAIVWRFDLERNHSFTIAMQGDEGDWELGITSAKGEFYPIVHFALREDAEDALDAVQKALMCRRSTKVWAFLKNFLLLLAIAALLFTVWSLLTAPKSSPGSPAASSIGMGLMPRPPAGAEPSIVPATPAVPPSLPSGIPLPADDVLRPPSDR